MDDTAGGHTSVDRRRRNLRRFSDALICYVRAVTDTWAYIVDPKTIGKENGASMLCNPMASMRHRLERDSNTAAVQVHFDIQVDDETSAGQVALLLIAIDSFVAIVSSGRAGAITLPANSRGGLDMESSIIGHGWAHPAGASGVFKYWQCSPRNTSAANANCTPLLIASPTTAWTIPPFPKATMISGDAVRSGSVFMSPEAAQQLANTCQNLKSVKRMRSLLCRYARFARALGKASKEPWNWHLDAAPLQLSLDLGNGPAEDIGTVFVRVGCKPSDRFGSVQTLVTATKNWVTATHVLIDCLRKNSIAVRDDDDVDSPDAMARHPPLVGEKAISLCDDLTLANVRVAEVIRKRMVYRIPKQGQASSTSHRMSDMANAGLGLTTDKYDRAVMVMDALLGEGCFYTSALNHMFFYQFFEEQGYPRLFHRNLCELVNNVVLDHQGSLETLRTFRDSSSRMRATRLAAESTGLTKLRELGAMEALCEYTSAE
uniref:Wsv045-like protein n=1 Tax=Melicertus latisulcatus pemonivirus TaxID=2984278 RepID=A0A9C7BMU0_9VIRU|nr:MAG: wsv045-like protein [Melicertus latisulcatus pemonivirus]